MNDTLKKTGFGNDVKPIACGIEIPLTFENFTFINGCMGSAFKIMLQNWFYDALDSDGILAKTLPSLSNEPPVTPVLAIVLGNKCFLIVFVTNWRRGFAIVRDRLEALTLMEFARISYRDYSEGIWRPLYPVGSHPFFPDEFMDGMLPKPTP